MILVIKERYILTVDFSMSAGMSPTGVALKLSRFKIIFQTKSSVVKKIFN